MSLTVVTFTLVTAELLPIGLLTAIARDLGVTEGTAGLILSVTGLTAAVAAPLGVLVVGRTDRRAVILVLSGLIAVASLVVAVAPNLAAILVGRIILGISVGMVWSFAGAVGRRLVPEASGGRAVALISAGVSAGMVLGVPAGTYVGHLAGWRVAFAAVACLAGVGMIAQITLLPPLPVTQRVGVRDLVGILVVRRARIGLVATVLVAGGQFVAYTYLEPFLSQVSRMSAEGIGLALVAFGVGGLLGNFAGERAMARNPRRAFAGTAAALAFAILLVVFAGDAQVFTTGAVTLWGFVFGAVPVCVQLWLYESAPDRFESGSSLMVLFFQVALAAGALGGGRLADRTGLTSTFVTGAVLSLAGALVIAVLGAEPVSAYELAPGVVDERA